MILSVTGTHDEKTIQQLMDVDERAKYTALMADGHFGYVMPIGGVAAYKREVSVVGVGFDIACGNCAAKTPLNITDLGDLNSLADQLARTFAFGMGLNNDHPHAPRDHELFSSEDWDIVPRDKRQALIDKARNQLGTLGSGNHYLDIFSDEDGFIWIGVHFGSRGFGHTVASSFLALAQGKKWGERVPEEETIFHVDGWLGSEYWALMNLAGDYAYAGRDWVVDTVLGYLGTHAIDRVHNNHNFAWEENHFGGDYIVVRKGATPAFPGQRGFVGGSMGDNSVILRGRYDYQAESKQKNMLYSTVHGAGRVMGRMQAKGKRNKDGSWKRKPMVDRVEMEEWLSSIGVIRRGGDLDEAPQAYRRLTDVLEDHSDTIVVEHQLTPLIVCMAKAGR